MKYLVTVELEGAAPANPQEFALHLEKCVIPDHERLVKFEKEGIVLAGGVNVGGRKSFYIVEAESNEALSKLLMASPLWNICQVEVIPLDSFSYRLNVVKQVLEKLKS